MRQDDPPPAAGASRWRPIIVPLGGLSLVLLGWMVGLPLVGRRYQALFALVWLVPCLLGLAISLGKVPRRVLLLLASLALTLALLESWSLYTNVHIIRQPEYVGPHPVLGYGPVPGLTSTARKILGGELIHTVIYSFDDNGLRRHPQHRREDAANILVFGDSFVLGEGVEGGQTLPAQLELLGKGKVAVHNFGFHGYGPHQMLARLQHSMEAPALTRGPTPWVIYVALLPAHIDRMSGRAGWDVNGPRYRVRDGKLVQEGRFAKPWQMTLLWLASRFCLYQTLTYAKTGVEEADIQAFQAVLAACKDLVEKRYGARFLVVLWAHPYQVDRIKDHLDAVDITWVSIRDILARPDQTRYILHPKDRHPSPLAYQEVAKALWKRLEPDLGASAAMRSPASTPEHAP